MHHKHAILRHGLLVALTFLTIIGIFSSSTVAAEESIFSNVDLFSNAYMADMMDGDVQVAGNHLAGVHLSVESQTQSARYVDQHNGQSSGDSGVHLSWKLSW
jgi:hypothetical protein